MTVTEPQTTDTLSQYVLAAAEACRGAISGAEGWTVELADPGAALPASGSRVVSGQIGPTTIHFVADPDLARHLQVGPPPADDLVEGVQPAFEAAVLALAPVLGSTAIGPLAEVDPTGLAISDGHDVGVATMHADGVHRATLLVAVPTTAPAPTPEAGLRLDPMPAGRLAAVPTGLELLHDVEMGVTAELGRTRMLVREVLELVPGSVIELDRAAGSPVDVLVNGTLIARGEVVVIDEEFGIRITEVVGHQEDRTR